jgi:hypothetical protein
MAIRLPTTPRAKAPSAKGSKAASAVAQINAQLQTLGQQYLSLTSAGDFVAALAVNAQAKALAPNHARIVGDAALCHLRLGDYALARDLYTQACALAPSDTNLRDGLTEACGHLGLMDEVRQNGCMALALKDAQSGLHSAWPLHGQPPPLSSDPLRNVIAFSLFGEQPRYCETAMLNVLVAKQLMPQWTCRFYVDETVPALVRARLAHVGAQVVLVNAQDRAQLSGLMWRFLVLQDPQVERYLLRDADSLISTREVEAVQAWLDSDHWFHVMRDYFSHTELLLAGMWGGCGGVFGDLRQGMVDYIAQGQYLGQRVVDQHYLRAHIWPTVRQSVLSHDSVFGFMHGQDFPLHAPHQMGDYFHVGCNLSGASIGAESALNDGQTVQWSLKNELDQEICRYATPVQAGAWRVDLPQPYVDQIRTGAWRVVVA